MTSIFLVHGSNVAAREETARFLEKIAAPGVDVDVLLEQPNRGALLLEKLERASGRAGYAVALLTADDEARRIGETELRPRARQNVIFEIGLFFGSLGRDKVAVLYDAGVEKPSDVEGLVHIERDLAGAWKLQLARELRDAGIPVDLNGLA